MRTYGQYCPIARTAELFAERWTPIIIRNLLAGCRTFADLLDGAPGISKALLAQRLELLEHSGIVTKEPLAKARGSAYMLTQKGRALKSVTDAMGSWGAQWIELEAHHIDPTYVLWATCKLVDVDKVPRKGLIARIDLADRPRERFWMLLKKPHAEICTTYPGGNEDLVVRTDSETLARWHLRHVTYAEASRAGYIHIDGAREAIEQFLASIRPSPFAHVMPAQTPGRSRSRI